MKYITQYDAKEIAYGSGSCWEMDVITVGEPNWFERLFGVRPTKTKVHYHCFSDTSYPPAWDWRTVDNNGVRFDVGVKLSTFVGNKIDKERNLGVRN